MAVPRELLRGTNWTREALDCGSAGWSSSLDCSPLLLAARLPSVSNRQVEQDHCRGCTSGIAAAKAIQADIADQFSRVGILATK
jgi:hypothetical protein